MADSIFSFKYNMDEILFYKKMVTQKKPHAILNSVRLIKTINSHPFPANMIHDSPPFLSIIKA